MTNIVVAQANRLIKERGFSVVDAVRIAYEQQKKRGMVKDGKITEMGKVYYDLGSEKRAVIRKAMEKGKKVSDYQYVDGRVLLKSK